MPTTVKDLTLYSVFDVSRMLNVTTVSIRNYIKQGHLNGQKLMGRWFVTEEDLNSFFSRLAQHSRSTPEPRNLLSGIFLALLKLPVDLCCFLRLPGMACLLMKTIFCCSEKRGDGSMPIQIRNITLFSVPEVSHVLNRNINTVRSYLKQGKLRGQKIHGKWVVCYDDLMVYLKGC